MNDPTRSTYADEAATQDRLLDGKITKIRAAEEAGELTIREAAEERVLAMEYHLAARRYLIAEHFGTPTEER